MSGSNEARENHERARAAALALLHEVAARLGLRQPVQLPVQLETLPIFGNFFVDGCTIERALEVAKKTKTPIYLNVDGSVSAVPTESPLRTWVSQVEETLRRAHHYDLYQAFVGTVERELDASPLLHISHPVVNIPAPTDIIDNTLYMREFDEIACRLKKALTETVTPLLTRIQPSIYRRELLVNDLNYLPTKIDSIMRFLRRIPDIFTGQCFVSWMLKTVSGNPMVFPAPGEPDPALDPGRGWRLLPGPRAIVGRLRQYGDLLGPPPQQAPPEQQAPPAPPAPPAQPVHNDDDPEVQAINDSDTDSDDNDYDSQSEDSEAHIEA